MIERPNGCKPHSSHFATAIIQDLLAEAQRSKVPVTLIVLRINPAKRLYERLGFRTVEEVGTGLTGIKCLMTTVVPRSSTDNKWKQIAG